MVFQPPSYQSYHASQGQWKRSKHRSGSSGVRIKVSTRDDQENDCVNDGDKDRSLLVFWPELSGGLGRRFQVRSRLVPLRLKILSPGEGSVVHCQDLIHLLKRPAALPCLAQEFYQDNHEHRPVHLQVHPLTVALEPGSQFIGIRSHHLVPLR